MGDRGNIYSDVMHAYSVLLKKIEKGEIDEQFVKSVNIVYTFVCISGQDMREQMGAEIYDIVKHQDSVAITFSVFSLILRIDAKALYMENFLQKIRSLQKISSLEWRIAGFYYRQLNKIRLEYPECDTETSRQLLSELVRRGIISCMRQLNVAMRPVPCKERRDDRAVVLVEEFLSEDSDYKKHVLDCCYQLQHDMRKEILFINTAEAASKAGEVSFLEPEYGERDSSLDEVEEIEWKGEKFAFFQCRDIFLDMDQTENAIKKILEYNPGMVIHIGEGSFFAGIIDEWIPVLSIGKEYGRYPVSATEFQAGFDSASDAEREFSTIIKDYEQTITEEGNLKARLVFPADYFKEEMRYAPHYEQGTWNTYTIRQERKKIWALELGMLKKFNEICQKHNIRYFAYKGTLLGAVKYHGFIPWDDDIDIAMKREDYERFADVAEEELGEWYCLMDAARVPRWEIPKVKILCVSDAKAVFRGEKDDSVFIPGIDITVLDYFPADEGEAERQRGIFEEIFLLWRKAYYNGGELAGHAILEFEELKRNLGYNINKKASVKNQLIQLHRLVAIQIAKDSSSELYHSCEYFTFIAYTQGCKILKREWYEGVENAFFENQSLFIPQMYSDILDAYYDGWRETAQRNIMLSEEMTEKDFQEIEPHLYMEKDLKEYKDNFFAEEKLEISYTGFNKVQEFFIEKKMKHAWAASLKVLKEVERICKKHGLHYFASYGTLLGAVRHQGYIPWDDDLDILMKREDYDRLLAIAKEELPEGYCMVDEVFNDKWTTNVSRVINVPSTDAAAYIMPHTEKEEEFFGCPYVIGVDVFPWDYVPWDREEAKIWDNLFANAIKVKYDLREHNNQMTEEIQERVEALSKACNYQFTEDKDTLNHILTLVGAIARIYGPDDGEYIVNMYDRFQLKGYQNGCREEWFTESITLPFETTTIEVPKEYIKVLVQFAGAWKICYNGSSTHDYPFYKKQDEDLERQGIHVTI